MTPIFAPYGTAYSFRAPVVKTGSTNFVVQADWGASGIGPQAGDVKVIKDGASIANITTLPVIYSTSYAWAFSLSAAEMSADEIIVQVVNRTYLTDQMFRIITAPDGAVRSRLAQAGASSTITLDTGAAAVDSLYNGNIVAIIAGTGIGQCRVITGYVGSTRVATVDSAWVTTPDATSVFALYPQALIGLTSAQVTAAVPSVSQISTQIFDTETIETGVTFRNWHKVVGALGPSIRTGIGTTTEVYKAINNSGTTRVTYVFPTASNGNPSSITYNFA
jgi:hypothetical protein